jgi:hypothetical protein
MSGDEVKEKMPRNYHSFTQSLHTQHSHYQHSIYYEEGRFKMQASDPNITLFIDLGSVPNITLFIDLGSVPNITLFIDLGSVPNITLVIDLVSASLRSPSHKELL